MEAMNEILSAELEAGALLLPEDDEQYPHNMKIYTNNSDGNEGWCSTIL